MPPYEVAPDLNITILPKRTPPRFPDFNSYHEFLHSGLKRLTENVRDERSKVLFYPMTTSFSNFSFLNVGSDGSLAGTSWTVSGNSKFATLQLLATVAVDACQDNASREVCYEDPLVQMKYPSRLHSRSLGLGCSGMGWFVAVGAKTRFKQTSSFNRFDVAVAMTAEIFSAPLS